MSRLTNNKCKCDTGIVGATTDNGEARYHTHPAGRQRGPKLSSRAQAQVCMACNAEWCITCR